MVQSVIFRVSALGQYQPLSIHLGEWLLSPIAVIQVIQTSSHRRAANGQTQRKSVSQHETSAQA
jgi:hypothetical protein